MWAIPGSHRTAPLFRRFVTDPPGSAPRFVPGDPAARARGEPPPELPAADDETVGWAPLPCAAGSLVILHGNVLHHSRPNRSGRSRPAYTVHVVEQAGHVWSRENWLQRDEGFEAFV